MASSKSVKAGSAYVEFGAKFGNLDKGIKKIAGKLDRLSNQAKNLSASFAKFGTVAGAGFGVALKQGAGFFDKIAELGASSNSTEKDLKKLTDTAKSVGEKSSFTLTETADAMVSLGRAGLTAKQNIAGVGTVLDVARVGGLGLGETADILAGIGNTFGINLSDLAQFENISDIIVTGSLNSSATIADLAESFKILGTSSVGVGLDLKETTRLISLLGKANVRGSVAGVQLGNVFKDIAGGKAGPALKKLGIETEGANGKIRDIVKIAKDLKTALEAKGFKGTGLFGEVAKIFDVRATRAILTLGNTTDENIAKVDKALDNGGKSAKRFSLILDDTLGGSFRKLVSALDRTAVAITEAVEKPARNLLSAFTKISSAITRLIDGQSTLLLKVFAVTASIVALSGALFTLGLTAQVSSFVMGGLAKVVGVVTTSIKFLFVNMIPIVGAFTAIAIAGATTAVILSRVFKADTFGIADFIADIKIAGTSLGTWFEIGGLEVLKVFNNISLEWEGFFQTIVERLSLIPSMFITAFSKAFSFVVGGLTGVAEHINKVLGKVGVNIGDGFIKGAKAYSKELENNSINESNAFANSVNKAEKARTARNEKLANDQKRFEEQATKLQADALSVDRKRVDSLDAVTEGADAVINKVKDLFKTPKVELPELQKTLGGELVKGAKIKSASEEGEDIVKPKEILGSFAGASVTGVGEKKAEKQRNQMVKGIWGLNREFQDGINLKA